MSFKSWCAAIWKEFIMEMPQTLLRDDSVDMNELFILMWNKQKFSTVEKQKKKAENIYWIYVARRLRFYKQVI